jgi:two-component system LytT family response regulator
MTKIKAIIVDDEALARDIVRKYLESYNQIELVEEFEDGFNALKGINKLKPDLVFLDIQMPKLTGMELLELVDDMPNIIFTTAYDEYAIKAFELNAIDYLLKPFSKDRFDKAVEKIIVAKEPEASKHIEQLDLQETIDKIVVKNNEAINIIPLDEILYIEAEDDYVMIHTANKKYLKHKTMKFYEKHLDSKRFARIHRSFIVNLNYITKIEKYGKDTYQVVLSSLQKLNVSRSRYQILKQIMSI